MFEIECPNCGEIITVEHIPYQCICSLCKVLDNDCQCEFCNLKDECKKKGKCIFED